MSRAVSLREPCIFQFPATIGRRISEIGLRPFPTGFKKGAG
jgi:hypothetical protein